jgi:hypothetical protein
MGCPVFVYGKSGCGKSRSLKNFGEDEIFFVNVVGKPLPFRKKFKYEFRNKDVNAIVAGLKAMPCKTAVIDDAGYLMTDQFMAGHSQPKKGATTFDLFNDIADVFYKLMSCIRDDLPDDVIVYILMHEISNDYGEVKLRTIGKLLDEKVCLEGMATIVIHAMSNGQRFWFSMQGNGADIAKAPEDMFQNKEIENDLKFVDDTIRNYYWNKEKEKK